VIVYGRNPVREALRGRRAVHRVWVTPHTAREPWLEAAGVPCLTASGEEIAARCGSEAHQGICAETDAYHYVHVVELFAVSEPLIVVLDQVQDPQNLGAVCRTAECAGATGVVIAERRAAEITPAVCKASAGAVEHLAVARVRNVADFLGEAKEHGIWCYGAAAEAGTPYEDADLSGPVALVLGSEGRGLRPRVAASCDLLLSLPLRGRIESLSVSAAAAVLIYAAARGRN
jgi:23S rRNA (guanosine2251-2'-O)-methyltransferase